MSYAIITVSQASPQSLVDKKEIKSSMNELIVIHNINDKYQQGVRDTRKALVYVLKLCCMWQ